MSAELLFSICNNGVLPAWLLLAVAPGWSWTQRIVHAIWIPALLGLAYAFALSSGSPVEGGSFFSLAGVMLFFTDPWAATAGWIHYLAFDLFVGAWQVRDARRNQIPHGLLLPCLIATLMLGPLGLLAYLALRGVLRRETSLVEAE
jgi:hypothetical protein